MNILYILHDSSTTGANMSFLDYIQDVDTVKNNIFIIMPEYNKYIVDKLKNKGITNIYVTKYKCYFLNYNHKNVLSRIKNVIKKMFFLKLIEKKYVKKILLIVKNNNIDIIHTNSFACWYGAYIAKKMNVPHVWHIRELMGKEFVLSHINIKKIKKLCNYSTAIYISDLVKEKYEINYQFKKSYVIYDKVYFDECYKHIKKFGYNDIYNIIYVGSLDVNKGVYELLNTFEKMKNLNNIHLFICGNGDLESYVINYIKSKQLHNVNYLGFRSDINEIRKNMDIALVCSNNEALGRTTIEAMYYKNLVIGSDSDNSCTKKIIKDGVTGFLYHKNDVDDLYNKIMYVINNRENSNRIINQASDEAISKYSNSIVLKVFEIYKIIRKEEK